MNEQTYKYLFIEQSFIYIDRRRRRLMQNIYTIKGLGCAHCGAKIESNVNKLPEVEEASLDLVGQRIFVEQAEHGDLSDSIQQIADQIEPGLEVYDENKSMELIEEAKEEKESTLKNQLIQLGVIIAVTLIAKFILGETEYESLGFAIALLIAGGPIYLTSIRQISKGEIFDENFLMSIATIGAFIVGEYIEAIGVMTFYRIGEFLQDLAMDRSRDSISSLLETDNDISHVLRQGNIFDVDPGELIVGDHIVVRPGETIPVDGVVLQGDSFLNNAAMTGESKPERVTVKDNVFSGSINQEGTLKIEVMDEVGDSAMAKVKKLVEDSSASKAPIERWMSQFARVYTPIVVAIAVFVGLVFPLITSQAFLPWIYKACIFLVISCPCALVLSIPLSIFAGIGRASENGIYLRGGDRLEALDSVSAIGFDKTGTLTDGHFKVVDTNYLNIESRELFTLGKTVEQFSNHPIATAIMEVEEGEILSVDSHKEIAGKGIVATLSDGREIGAGNRRLMETLKVRIPETEVPQTTVWISADGELMGQIVLSDSIKDGVEEAIKKINAKNIKTYLFSGDRDALVTALGKKLSLTGAKGSLLPQDKLLELEKLMDSQDKGYVAYVGDGINDAPVLARSDIGISMGGTGSDIAIASSDVVLLNDDIRSIHWLLNLAHQTKKVTYRNIFFALGVKILIMILGLLGIANMWMALFADVGVALIAVLYSMTLLNWDK